MHFSIDTGDPRPIYVQIMDEVRRAIVLGTIRPDESLPSVRQLASELRLNPNTIKQAYRELERAGIVYVRRGHGTFVSPDAHPEGGDRRALAREVAQRALVDAHRHGLRAEEVVTALAEIGALRAERPAPREP
jgi:GntR family transcriptional regulator